MPTDKLDFQLHIIRFCTILLLFLGLIPLGVAQISSLPDGGKPIAQDVEKTYVRNIIIEGNKKTKPIVIIREMGFGEGDPIPTLQLMAKLENARVNIFNMKIFTNVSVNIKNWENDSLDVVVSVVERWYIIPMPIFQLADRNFNEWWVDRGRDFSRIQYGASLNWENFRGRNERLRVSASLGFAQLLELDYHMPGLSSGGKLGAAIYFNVMRSKRLPYNTINDKLEYLSSDDFIKKSFEISPQLIIRKNIFVTHFLEARYGYRWIADEVAAANPDFLLEGNTQQNFFKIGYRFEWDKRDVKAYPTGGHYLIGSFENYGLGLQPKVDLTKLTVDMRKYFTLDKNNRHATGHMVKGQYSFPQQQPYNLQRGLGYLQDFVRGYEYFVVDGQDYALLKNEYKYRITSFRMGDMFKNKLPAMMNSIPFSIYAKAYFDAGYVRDRYFTLNNTLRNQWIYGWGAGIDIVTYNNRLLRLEYSFNKKLQNGLYLHIELPL